MVKVMNLKNIELQNKRVKIKRSGHKHSKKTIKRNNKYKI